jgi:hypothetical protein
MGCFADPFFVRRGTEKEADTPWWKTVSLTTVGRSPVALDAITSRKRLVGAQQRRTLQSVAGTPFGATEATMSVSGFTRQTFMPLICTGLTANSRARLRLAANDRPRQDR